MSKLNAVVKRNDGGEIEDIYFDVTLLINLNNEVIVVDNSQHDWKDLVDCDILCMKEVKIPM